MTAFETLRRLAVGRFGVAVLVATMAVASVLLIPRLAPEASEMDVYPVVSVSGDGTPGSGPES